MSNSVQPHRWQPTRLSRPWDSPGKNIGVDCHFLLQCVKMKNESEVAQSCVTLRDPMDCSSPGSYVHGIFQARVLEWGAIAFSEDLNTRCAHCYWMSLFPFPFINRAGAHMHICLHLYLHIWACMCMNIYMSEYIYTNTHIYLFLYLSLTPWVHTNTSKSNTIP